MSFGNRRPGKGNGPEVVQGNEQHRNISRFPTTQSVSLMTIKRFCRDRDLPFSRFGREAVNDSRLVSDLMNGRELRPETQQRVAAYIISLGAR